MVPRFHLRVFGPPTVLGAEGEILKLRTRKQLGLFVYLVLNPESAGVSRATLADLLWPDVTEPQARHSLSQGLTAIRSLMGRDAVPGKGQRLSLASPVVTDLDVISRPIPDVTRIDHPLEDLDDCGGVEFGHWVDGTRQHLLSAARAELVRALGEARRQGKVDLVHVLARRLYQADPLSEPAAQTLAERALLDGDTSGAVDLLESFLARARRRAHGPEHRSVRRLLERIGSSSLTHALSSASSSILRTKERFVGRADEIRALEAAWQQASAGTLQTCLMSGVAGIGKTSLLRRFATSVSARGNLALVIRCEEIGTAVPFAALADLIDELAKDPSLGGTDPYWLAEASRIAPALKARFPGLPAPDSATGEAIRLRVAEAFFRMLETVADGSALLIAIDDMQHLDHASRDVLHILKRRIQNSPAVIAVAERKEGLASSTALDRRTPDIWKWHVALNIPSLAVEEARTLAGLLTDDLSDRPGYDRIVTSIVQLADGNPYFLELLISDWRGRNEDSLAATQTKGDVTGATWRPPDALRLAFSRQYEGLGARGRQTLELLAVSGREMTAREIGDIIGLAVADASQIVLGLIERGVLRLEGDAVSFKNELHRAFVYYAMSDDTRRYHHARLARTLMQDSDRAPHGALEASHHFVRAAMPVEAMQCAVRGAKAALLQGAPREAERALRNTYEIVESPPADATVLLAEALNQQGLYAASLESLAHIDGAISAQPVRSTVAALRAEARVRGRIGDDEQIQSAVQVSVREARRTKDNIQVLKILQTAAEFAVDNLDSKRVKELGGEAQEILAGGSVEKHVSAFARMTAGFCSWARGRFADSFTHLSLCSTILEESGHTSLVRALNGRGVSAVAIGEYGIGIETYERALFYAERTGDYPAACNIAGNSVTALIDLGDLEYANRQAQRAIAFEELASDSRYRSKVFNDVASLRLLEEDFGEAGKWLGKAKTAARQNNLPREWAEFLLTRADYHLATGSPEEALQLISTAEAELPSPTRIPSNSYQGAMLRLPEYRAWRVEGIRPKGHPFHDEELPTPLPIFVELAAFREWLAEQDGNPPAERPNAEDLIRATGLYGVKRLLCLVGMYPTGTSTRSPA